MTSLTQVFVAFNLFPTLPLLISLCIITNASAVYADALVSAWTADTRLINYYGRPVNQADLILTPTALEHVKK